MRVVLLVNSLGKAGAELQAVQLVEHLVSVGHEARVVTLLPAGDLADRLTDAGVSVESVGTQPVLALARLIRILRRGRADTLVTLLFQANIVGLIAGAFARTPRIVTAVRNERFGGRHRELLLRMLLPLGHVEVANSRRAARSLLERRVLRHGRVEVIYNGLDLDRLATPTGTRERVRSELQLGESFVWLCPARLVSPQKGHTVLLEAFATLAETDPTQRLLLAGGGRDRQALEQQAERLGIGDAVTFLGETDGVADLLAAADAVVLASAWEGLPNAVMEAMGKRLPVVATAVGGIPELIEDGATGVLVPPGEPGALASAMATVSSMPSAERASMGSAGFRRITRIADLGQVARQWEGILRPSVGVALFLPSFAGGGAQRVFMTVAAELATRPVGSCLVVVNAEGPLAPELSPDVRLVELGHQGTARSLPALVRFLRVERPAVLISTLDNASVWAVVAARIARRRTAVAVRVANTTSLVAAQRGVSQRILYAAARRLYPRAAARIAPSHGAADDLARWLDVPRDTIDVVPNPVVGPTLMSGRSDPVDHPWFEADGPPVVMACSRFEPHKGLLTLVRSFASVRAARADAKLLILGDGPDRSRIEAEASRLGLEVGPSGDVHMPGFDPNPFRFMARSAVFVLSSEREGLPGVLIQALASGARVVATDCPSGPREILDGGRFGRLVPVADERAMTAAIIESLDEAVAGENPPSPEAWKPYEVDTAMDAYMDLIERLWPECPPSRQSDGFVSIEGDRAAPESAS